MATWKEKYNKKYGHEKNESHSLVDIAKDTGISKKGLQQIYNKGVGAWKNNIGSVRLKKNFSKNPNTKKYPRKARLGKEQWAMARVYSAVMGGKAAKVDAKELKMQMGGTLQSNPITSNVKDRIEFLKFILEYDKFGRTPYEILSIENELAQLIRKTFKKGGELEEIDWTEYYGKGGINEKINWSEYYEKGGIMDENIRAKIFDKNGNRKIDEKSIDILTDYVNSLPQTKSMYFDKKTNRYTPNRRVVHQKIIDSFKDNLVCIESDEPIAILMGGSPASGKSTFLRKYAPYLLSTELLRIDADEVRSMLPEYEGWNASQTHLETKDIVNTLLSDRTIGLPCNFDLIYDGTMNNTKSYIPLIKLLRSLGYKIFVVYVDNVPKDEIVDRALNRYKNSGRFVPLEVIDDFFTKGKKALNEIKELSDGYMIVDGGSNDYAIIEEGGEKLPQNRLYSNLGRGIEDYDDEKLNYYETYYKNVSPSIFDVNKNKNKIEISGFGNKYPKNFKTTDVKQYKVPQSFKKGGETNFNPDGKIKDKIVHTSGDAGGMLVGKRHSEGGIKAYNKSTGQPLEMEGGEVVITRDAVSDTKKRSFNGKMMTNRQILSAINESGGGVSFADGGEVPENVNFDCDAQYEYGGKTMCGKDLAYAMGGVTTAIVTNPNEAMDDLQATYGFGDVYKDGGVIECTVCSWSWNEKDGGNDKYVCHKCGTDNSSIYLEKGGFVAASTFTEKDDFLPNFFYQIQRRPDAEVEIYFLYDLRQIKDNPIIDAGTYYTYKSDSRYSYESFVVLEEKSELINLASDGEIEIVEDIVPLDYYKYTLPRDFNETQKNILADEITTNLKPLEFIEIPFGRSVIVFRFESEVYGGSNQSNLEIFNTKNSFALDFRALQNTFNFSFPSIEKIKVSIDAFNDDVFFYSLESLLNTFASDDFVESLESIGGRIDVKFKPIFVDGRESTEFTIRGYNRKPRKGSWRAKYNYGYKTVKKDPIQFLETFFYQLEQVDVDKLNAFNLTQWVLGDSDAAKKALQKTQDDLAKKKEQAKKEKAEQKIRNEFIADINKTNFFDYIKDESVFISNLKDKNALLKMLPSFQGIKFAKQRAQIVRELSKIEKDIYNLTIGLQSDADNIFTNEGLLDYYFQQTTQSPVKKLGRASKLPTPNGEESKLPLGAYLNVREPQFLNWFGNWIEAYETNDYTNCSIMVNDITKEPKVFYHGVRKFNPNMKGSNLGAGVVRPYGAFTPSKFPASYFAEEKSYAEFYSGQSKNLPKGLQSKGFIYPVFLNIKKPLDLRPLGFEATYLDFQKFIVITTGIRIKLSQSVVDKLEDINKKAPVWVFVRNDVQVIETLKDYGYDGLIQIGDIPIYDKSGKPISDRTKWKQEVEYLTFYPNQVKSAVAKKSFYFPMFDDIRFKEGGYVSI